MVESVLIVRHDLELCPAIRIIGIIVKFGRVEHISNSISIHGHGLVPTGQDIPAAHVLVWRVIGINIVALGFVEGVVVLDWLPQRREKDAIVGKRGHAVERNAWGVGRPGSHVFEEGCGIGIVYHGHIGVGNIYVANEELDVLVAFDGGAGVEPTAQTGNWCCRWLGVS